jgi:hypothetical protein
MPNTDAASVPGLRVGQLMLKVNGRSILGAKTPAMSHFYTNDDHFTKTGLGQT